MCIYLNLTCGDFCFEASLSESALPFRTLSGYLTDNFRIKKRGATTIGSTKWVKSANLTHVNWTVGIFFPVVVPSLKRKFLFFLEDHFFLAKNWQAPQVNDPSDAVMQLLVYKHISFCLAQKRYQPGKSSGKKPWNWSKPLLQPTFNQHSTNIGFLWNKMGGSWNRDTHFPFKQPSILGYPHWWKTPNPFNHSIPRVHVVCRRLLRVGGQLLVYCWSYEPGPKVISGLFPNGNSLVIGASTVFRCFSFVGPPNPGIHIQGLAICGE